MQFSLLVSSLKLAVSNILFDEKSFLRTFRTSSPMQPKAQSTLYYRESGSGAALLLIPGLAGFGKFWEPVAALLSASHRTVSVDHPGMSGSSSPFTQSIDTIAIEIIRLLDDLQLSRCNVVGHSTGGLVAQALALDYETRVHRIILSSTWAQPDRRFRDLFRLRQQVLRTAGSNAYFALGRLLGYPAQWYEEKFATADPIDFEREPSVDVKLTIERIDMLLNYRRVDELHRLMKPTLVIGARDDNIVTFNHALDLVARVPGAKLVELAGGHFAPTTATFEYARVVNDFLGETS